MIYFAVYKLTLKKYLFIYMGASKIEHSLTDDRSKLCYAICSQCYKSSEISLKGWVGSSGPLN